MHPELSVAVTALAAHQGVLLVMQTPRTRVGGEHFPLSVHQVVLELGVAVADAHRSASAEHSFLSQVDPARSITGQHVDLDGDESFRSADRAQVQQFLAERCRFGKIQSPRELPLRCSWPARQQSHTSLPPCTILSIKLSEPTVQSACP